MEQLSPIPLQSNDEGAKEQETRHFDIIEISGGRGGPDVPFILSKISHNSDENSELITQTSSQLNLLMWHSVTVKLFFVRNN